jgi:raffinose/stachyose/melibiose transport system substrate-binding protein
MAFHRPWRRVGLLVAAFVGALALAACGGLGEENDDSGGAGGKVALSFLVDNSEQTLTPAKALASAFHAKNPNITIKVETRPQGPTATTW